MSHSLIARSVCNVNPLNAIVIQVCSPQIRWSIYIGGHMRRHARPIWLHSAFRRHFKVYTFGVRSRWHRRTRHSSLDCLQSLPTTTAKTTTPATRINFPASINIKARVSVWILSQNGHAFCCTELRQLYVKLQK